MKMTFKSVCGFGLATLLAIAAYAASSSFTCSVRQGFNFEKDSQEPIGYINFLKIGDMEMAADLDVTDPMNVAKQIKVFGVVSGIHWNGGYAEPVTFSAQVSVNNKNGLATLLHKSMPNTEVDFQFTIYDYDTDAKKYYQCFHSNAQKLRGMVLKQGGELAMNVNMGQSSEVVSPKNHTFQLGVMPRDFAQQIHLAFSSSAKLVKAWGVTVTGASAKSPSVLKSSGTVKPAARK